MEVIADLQLHSKYSRAVSPQMVLAGMAAAASQKGIGLIATGDWQHPLWFDQIENQLQEERPGVYALQETPLEVTRPVRFLLVSELSCVYTRNGKGRRVHHLIFSPSLEVCRKVIKALRERGFNLASDGRPIIGISSRHLLELLLAVDERIMLIPAHVWTPWFGLYGSKSGYDSLQECFGDLSDRIYAVETGLSSDPWMNWQIAELDSRSLVSFSDAHSGPKMGREATVFKVPSDFSYDDVTTAIRQTSSNASIIHTIEFFPEEGKYHWSGHREHAVCLSPEEVRVRGNLCPVCGKPLTEGVAQRIDSLADRHFGLAELEIKTDEQGVAFVQDPSGRHKPFVSLIPLLEILETLSGSPAKSKREYERLVAQVSEFEILLKLSQVELGQLGGEALAVAIAKVRQRQVQIQPGCDGVFGKVSLL